MNKRRWFFWALSAAVVIIAATVWVRVHPGDRKAVTGQADSSPGIGLDAHLSESYTDDLPALIKKKYIRVLTTINRTNFFLSDGHLVGYEYSLLKDYRSFLNKSISAKNLQVVMEFIPVARNELIPKLLEGYGDIAAAGLTITPERAKKVAFTDPYLTGINEVVVTSRGGFTPRSLTDLSGRKIYVRKSSSYFEHLTQLNKQFKEQGKKPVKIIPLDEDLETESILEMVNTGALAATVADSHIAEAWSRVLKNLAVHENVTLSQGSEIAWMVRPQNSKLRESLNAFLKTHKKGSLLGNIYFNRYYENSKKLQDPLGIEEWDRLKKCKSVIKKYAAQYDFDWLLILAVAFQESGLNNAKKSGAGAVGLMQVLPSTARDKNINIADVYKVDNNIHAGVKYLSFLKNRYYSDEDILPKDQIRFTLAAYNAGPAKIRETRALAEKMGLDKNKWFRNVEVAALRNIGTETVRYVSNINKYYVLYRTILEQNAADG